MRTPEGRAFDVPDSQVEDAKRQGFTIETPEQRSERLTAEVRAEHEAPRKLGITIAIVIGSVVGLLILIAILWSAGRKPRPPARAVLDASAAHGERLWAPDGTIAVVPAQSIEFAIRDGYRRIPKVDMRTPQGAHVLVDEDQVPMARAQGYWSMTPSEVATMADSRRQR